MNVKETFPPTTKRVALNTNKKVNENIEQETINNINKFKDASFNEFTARIEELDKEWDIERVLEVNAATIVFVTTILGFTLSIYWFILTGLVGFFLLQHAVQGWCPSLSLIRMLAVRTSEEINNEKVVLKILRGDFENKKDDYLKLYEASKE